MQQDKIKVTETQNKYLLLIEAGLETTNDLMRELMVSTETAGKMIRTLRKKGLLMTEKKRGARGNIHSHTLVKPYADLDIHIKDNKGRAPIPEEEILYAAILRNAGLTGQRLSEQYQKVFPKRRRGAIKNIVGKARKELCR